MLHDIAVLIDADNVSHQRIDWIFEQINHLGQITTPNVFMVILPNRIYHLGKMPF